MTPDITQPFNASRATKPSKGKLRRAILGGGLTDLGRLPRYFAFALLGSTLIWAPITGYLKTAPLSYTSQTSLILPGSGASASLNLNGIGQASSYANSAFASNAVSPTETYKRLLNADRVLAAAADMLGIAQSKLGQPRVDLVDQTSLIHFEMTGGSPIDAQSRGDAILAAFFTELDALRADEQQTREDSSLTAIYDYRLSVANTRGDIAMLQVETGLFSVAQYDALLAHQAVLEAEVRSQEATVSEMIANMRALEAGLGLDAATAAITLKLFADGAYTNLIGEGAIEAAALADAAAKYGPQHPKVLEATSAQSLALHAAQRRASQITGVEIMDLPSLDLAPAGARAELLLRLVELSADCKGAEEQLSTLSAQHAVALKRLQDIAPAAARLQDLQRDFSVAEAVFASAIARTETTKSDVYASYPLAQVLENPSLPEKPSSPNRKLAIAAGGAATFMMLIGLILGWARLAIIGRLLNKPIGDA